MPACFWPLAAKCFCHHLNIENGDDGESPWYKRHKKHFSGPRIPFGALVDFLPTSVQKPAYVKWTKGGKLNPRAIPGVFMGYRLQAGLTWRNEFIAAALEDFLGIDFRVNARVSVPVHVVRELVASPHNRYEFPLKAMYD